MKISWLERAAARWLGLVLLVLIAGLGASSARANTATPPLAPSLVGGSPSGVLIATARTDPAAGEAAKGRVIQAAGWTLMIGGFVGSGILLRRLRRDRRHAGLGLDAGAEAAADATLSGERRVSRSVARQAGSQALQLMRVASEFDRRSRAADCPVKRREWRMLALHWRTLAHEEEEARGS